MLYNLSTVDLAREVAYPHAVAIIAYRQLAVYLWEGGGGGSCN